MIWGSERARGTSQFRDSMTTTVRQAHQRNEKLHSGMITSLSYNLMFTLRWSPPGRETLRTSRALGTPPAVSPRLRGPRIDPLPDDLEVEVGVAVAVSTGERTPPRLSPPSPLSVIWDPGDPEFRGQDNVIPRSAFPRGSPPRVIEKLVPIFR